MVITIHHLTRHSIQRLVLSRERELWSPLLSISSALQVSWQRWRGLVSGKQKTASLLWEQYVLVLISALLLSNKLRNLCLSGNCQCPSKRPGACTRLDWTSSCPDRWQQVEWHFKDSEMSMQRRGKVQNACLARWWGTGCHLSERGGNGSDWDPVLLGVLCCKCRHLSPPSRLVRKWWRSAPCSLTVGRAILLNTPHDVELSDMV